MLLKQLKDDLMYEIHSLSVDNFEPNTRKEIAKTLDNIDKLIETLNKIPTIHKIQDNTFPIGSVCNTYSSSASVVEPTYPGEWKQCGTIMGNSSGVIFFWRRTA